MKDEMVEVMNQDGQPTGIYKMRSHVHRSGEWHNSVHVWVIYEDKVLLQKRNADRESFPDMYDVSAAGHVSAGETPELAAVRETEEEIALRIDEKDLISVGVLRLCYSDKQKAYISNEFNYIFAYKSDHQIENIHYDTREMQSIDWVHIEDLKRDIEAHPSDYCISLEELNLLLKEVF